jgi:hypothetical protein
MARVMNMPQSPVIFGQVRSVRVKAGQSRGKGYGWVFLSSNQLEWKEMGRGYLLE